MATDLLVAFIAIEVMSLATYSLAAYLRRGKRPSEAAFKYLVLGAFSSALLLYGAALLYGATGSTLFSELREGAAARRSTSPASASSPRASPSRSRRSRSTPGRPTCTRARPRR